MTRTATEALLFADHAKHMEEIRGEARAATLATIAGCILGGLLTRIDPQEKGELETAHEVALDRAELLFLQARARGRD